MNFSTALKTLLILELSVSVGGDSSCILDWIGDTYCDDENNHDGCDYDGGKVIRILIRTLNFQLRPVRFFFNSKFSLS